MNNNAMGDLRKTTLRVGKHEINIVVGTEVVKASTFAYALGFDESEGQLYVGDAKDFASLGEVTVIDRTGNEVGKT